MEKYRGGRRPKAGFVFNGKIAQRYQLLLLRSRVPKVHVVEAGLALLESIGIRAAAGDSDAQALLAGLGLKASVTIQGTLVLERQDGPS